MRAADAALTKGTTLDDLYTATRAIADTETEAARDRAEARKAGVQKVADAAAEEMSTEFMDTAMADLHTITHPTTEQKSAALIRMLAVCRDWRDRNPQQLVQTANQVKLQSGHPEVADWERRLDRARHGLLAVVLEAVTTPDECLGPVVENGRQVVMVSREVFTQALGDTPIPPKLRLDAAQNSGVAAAIALAQRLMADPRDLKLSPQTPEQDRIAGQPVVFTLGGLDPDWDSGVGVVVEWGDGTPPRQTDAERLRQGDRLEHLYSEVRTVHPVAVAADRFVSAPAGAAPRPDGPELGRSVAEVFVRPAPATTAERVADIFLSAQFGLALLIASVVYFCAITPARESSVRAASTMSRRSRLAWLFTPRWPTCRRCWRTCRSSERRSAKGPGCIGPQCRSTASWRRRATGLKSRDLSTRTPVAASSSPLGNQSVAPLSTPVEF